MDKMGNDRMEQTIEHASQTVYCAVSPCSWMYPDYGFQFGLSLVANATNIASKFVVDKTKAGMAVNEMPAEAMTQAKAWLELNGLDQLIKAKAAADAGREYFAAQRAAQEDKLKAQLAKFKAQGFTHRFVGVVHRSSGDDKMVDAVLKGVPSAADISKLLRGCVVKTDYKVTEL